MAIAQPIAATLATIASATFLVLPGGSPRASPPAPGDADPRDRLTRPALVALDFRDRPLAEVVAELGRRSGRTIVAQDAMTKGVARANDPGWRDRRVTLEAPAPVPLWEAVDRLAAAGRVGFRLGDFGDTGAGLTGVAFEEEAGAPGAGLVVYSGPFRVALLGVHEHRDRVFVQGRWVQVYPSGSPGPVEASELATAPPDGGPLYAQMQVMAEPGLICRRNGALKGLEAVDDRGRSLLASSTGRPIAPWTQQVAFDRGILPAVRIPLRRPDDGPARTTLRRLRGTIPVEIAVLRPAPALVVTLGDAEGQTFRGGGFTVQVRTNQAEPDGRVTVALTVWLDEAMDAAVRSARNSILMGHQFRFVDARGQPAHFGSAFPPIELRAYDVVGAATEVPFDFSDLPMP